MAEDRGGGVELRGDSFASASRVVAPTVLTPLPGSRRCPSGAIEAGALVRQHSGLVLFFQLNHDDLNRFVTGIDVGVHGIGRIGGQPISFAGFPDVRFGGAALFDNLHGAAGHGDDYAGMFVAVHGEGCVRKNDGLPDFHGVIFEKRGAPRLRLGRHGLPAMSCEKK